MLNYAMALQESSGSLNKQLPKMTEVNVMACSYDGDISVS